jgi:hypothetical protein
MEMASFLKLFGGAFLSGLILFDGTPAYRSPDDRGPVARYATGEPVEIAAENGLPRETARGGESLYEIKSGTGTVWVPSRAVRVSTETAEDSGRAFPLDFYRRAARSRNSAARALGARGLVLGLKSGERLDAWRAFQRDPDDAVRCAANRSFSERVAAEGPPADPRFAAALFDALARVTRGGGWNAEALCGLDQVLLRSSDPDKIALQCLLAIRHLGECPPDARPEDAERALALLKRNLTHPDAWVRRNAIAQTCDAGVSTATVKVLDELFPTMSPDDKREVAVDDSIFKDWEAARPLMLRIVGLIDDKSQPEELRLAALGDDEDFRAEKRDVLRRALEDSSDPLRLVLADGYCQDRDVLLEASNHGDEATFARALRCLEAHIGKIGGNRFHRRVSEWSEPGLDAGLLSVADPSRRSRLERPLECLLGRALCPVRLSADDDSGEP